MVECASGVEMRVADPGVFGNRAARLLDGLYAAECANRRTSSVNRGDLPVLAKTSVWPTIYCSLELQSVPQVQGVFSASRRGWGKYLISGSKGFQDVW